MSLPPHIRRSPDPQFFPATSCWARAVSESKAHHKISGSRKFRGSSFSSRSPSPVITCAVASRATASNRYSRSSGSIRAFTTFESKGHPNTAAAARAN